MATKLANAQGHVILQNGHTELLILDQYVSELKKLEEKKDFAEYFRSTALVNRNARRLFDSWIRKEPKLWSRLFEYVHHSVEMPSSETNEEQATQTSSDEASAQ